jgi:hypothetical protein
VDAHRVGDRPAFHLIMPSQVEVPAWVFRHSRRLRNGNIRCFGHVCGALWTCGLWKECGASVLSSKEAQKLGYLFINTPTHVGQGGARLACLACLPALGDEFDKFPHSSQNR